jgi:hypothetical protein
VLWPRKLYSKHKLVPWECSNLLNVLSYKDSLQALVCAKLDLGHKPNSKLRVLDKQRQVWLVNSKWLGSVQEWRERVSRRCKHNSNLVLGYRDLGLVQQDRLQRVKLKLRHSDSRHNKLVRLGRL